MTSSRVIGNLAATVRASRDDHATWDEEVHPETERCWDDPFIEGMTTLCRRRRATLLTGPGYSLTSVRNNYDRYLMMSS